MKTYPTILILTTAILINGGCSSSVQKATLHNNQDTQSGTVEIEIELDGQTKSIELEAIANGTSLESVLRNIQDVPFQINGSGTSAFVHSIDGVATTSGEGWTFYVDGEWASQGIGSTQLSPPTKVTWRFGAFDSAASATTP